MIQSIPARAEVISLGTNTETQDPPVGSPVHDTPPLEIKDTPPREPAPWITPQPGQNEGFSSDSTNA